MLLVNRRSGTTRLACVSTGRRRAGNPSRTPRWHPPHRAHRRASRSAQAGPGKGSGETVSRHLLIIARSGQGSPGLLSMPARPHSALTCTGIRPGSRRWRHEPPAGDPGGRPPGEDSELAHGLRGVATLARPGMPVPSPTGPRAPRTRQAWSCPPVALPLAFEWTPTWSDARCSQGAGAKQRESIRHAIRHSCHRWQKIPSSGTRTLKSSGDLPDGRVEGAALDALLDESLQRTQGHVERGAPWQLEIASEDRGEEIAVLKLLATDRRRSEAPSSRRGLDAASAPSARVEALASRRLGACLERGVSGVRLVRTLAIPRGPRVGGGGEP